MTAASAGGEKRPGDRLRRLALGVLAVPGLAGAVLSWDSMRLAAAHVFDPHLAVAFPALVDALALGAALRWVASVRDGTAIAGWRVTAHTAVGASILLNALAASTPAEVPWHVTAPAVWSALVELFARDMARAWQHDTRHDRMATDRIPIRLWLLAPRESARTWIRQARSGQTSAIAARTDADRIAAAAVALAVTLPGRRHRRTRREITRRLAAGTLAPAAVPDVLGWSATPSDVSRAVIQAATRAALTGSTTGTGLVETSIGARSNGSDLVRESDPTRSDRAQPDPVESDRLDRGRPVAVRPVLGPTDRTDVTPGGSAAGSSPYSTRSFDPSAAHPSVGGGVTARPADVAALRAAITHGHLPARPSVEAVRTHLKISAAYARAARNAFHDHAQHPEPTVPAEPVDNAVESRTSPAENPAEIQNTSNSEGQSPINSESHSRDHYDIQHQHQQEDPEPIPRATTPLHVHR